jgi:DNA-binding XRE family transcriptional regulator
MTERTIKNEAVRTWWWSLPGDARELLDHDTSTAIAMRRYWSEPPLDRGAGDTRAAMRATLGFSKLELDHHTGINRQTIARWEINNKKVGIKHREIAGALYRNMASDIYAMHATKLLSTLFRLDHNIALDGEIDNDTFAAWADSTDHPHLTQLPDGLVAGLQHDTTHFSWPPPARD